MRSRREAISLRVDELVHERKIATEPQYDQKPGEPELISVDISKFPDPIVVFRQGDVWGDSQGKISGPSVGAKRWQRPNSIIFIPRRSSAQPKCLGRRFFYAVR